MHIHDTKTYRIGGELEVLRLGFGAMRITGPGNWGYPADRNSVREVLRRALELGVQLIDTSDAYGPHTSEEMICDALYPYPVDLVIATKGGVTRQGPNLYGECGRPDYIRQSIELSLRRLKLDCIDVYQLHRVDPQVPLEETIGAISDARDEGKVRFIGLSEVGIEQLHRAQSVTPIASVQNLFNVSDRNGWSGDSEVLVDYCAANDIAFLPWAPLDRSVLTQPDNPLARLSKEVGVAPGQLALAWLLARSPTMMPIPGTSSRAHLEENMSALDITLSTEMFAQLEQLATAMPSPFSAGAPPQGVGR